MAEVSGGIERFLEDRNSAVDADIKQQIFKGGPGNFSVPLSSPEGGRYDEPAPQERPEKPAYPGDSIELPDHPDFWGRIVPAKASELKETDAGLMPFNEAGEQMPWIRRPGFGFTYQDPDVGTRAAMPGILQVLGNTSPAPIAAAGVMGTTAAKLYKAGKTGANPNELSMFAGRYAEGANLEALAHAQKLLGDSNASSKIEKIGKETGWWKGLDDKWRFEFSDDAAKVRPEFAESILQKSKDPSFIEQGAEFPLSQVFEHEKLFKAYPETKDIKFRIEGFQNRTFAPDEALGWFSPRANTVAVSPETAARALTDPEVKATLLHEIQHWVQNKEGFSGGVDPREFILTKNQIDIAIVRARIAEKAGEIRMMGVKEYMAANPTKEFRDLPDYVKQSYVESAFNRLSPEDRLKYQSALPVASKNDTLAIEEVKRQYEGVLGRHWDNKGGYRGNAGEQESRSTEHRMRMTEDERKLHAPEHLSMFNFTDSLANTQDKLWAARHADMPPPVSVINNPGLLFEWYHSDLRPQFHFRTLKERPRRD
jgi:hypothetical protein